MTVRLKLQGIYTPLITPFFEDDSIDFDSLSALIKRLISAGVHGLISGGSKGKNYAKTGEERLTLARFIMQQVKGRNWASARA